MRSRYSAFAKSLVDYLIATRHISMRRAEEAQSLSSTISDSEWTGLRILAVKAGSVLDAKGEVEFVASFRDRTTGAVGELRERSRFVREGDRWFYLDGHIVRQPFGTLSLG